MLAKKTVKNQLTLPKKIVDLFPDVSYFEVKSERGGILLLPVRQNRMEALRRKMARLGLSPSDLTRAVKWSRRNPI